MLAPRWDKGGARKFRGAHQGIGKGIASIIFVPLFFSPPLFLKAEIHFGLKNFLRGEIFLLPKKVGYTSGVFKTVGRERICNEKRGF